MELKRVHFREEIGRLAQRTRRVPPGPFLAPRARNTLLRTVTGPSSRSARGPHVLESIGILLVRLKMWKRKIVIIVVVCTLAFVFAVPIRSAESPGAVINPATGSSCCIHYRRSLSCLFLGIGDNYWDGTLSLGCEPIVV